MDEWLRKRRRSGAATSGAFKARSSSLSASRAPIPPEAPTLPQSFQARPALLSTLKRTVLEPTGGTTAVTASSRGAAQTTAAHGMGGVGKVLRLSASPRRHPHVGIPT